MWALLNNCLELLSIGALLLFAGLVVAVGSIRAVLLARRAKSETTGSGFQPATLRWQHALMFPVIGSIMLATLYLAFSYIQHFLILYIVFAATAAIAFTCMPICANGSDSQRAGVRVSADQNDEEGIASSTTLSPPAARSNLLVCSWASVSSSAAVAAATVIAWAWVGGPLLNNAVGTAMCIAMLSLVRLPSLRVAALLLFALLVYDFYWVFLSQRQFGDNVMVHVATQEASNPLHAAAAAVAAVAVPGGEQAVAALLPVQQLSPPNKLEFPVLQWRPTGSSSGSAADSSIAAAAAESAGRLSGSTTSSGSGSWVVAWMMLGLGDIALPGMLAVLAHAVDDAVRRGDAHPDDVRVGSISSAATALTAAAGVGAATPVRLQPSMGGHTLQQRGVAALLKRLLCRLTAARRLRRELWDRPGPSLFRACMIGYIAGLAVTFIAGRWMRAAQPALVYIVPCTVIPVWLHARRIGGRTLSLLWAGLPEPPPASAGQPPLAAAAGGAHAAGAGTSSSSGQDGPHRQYDHDGPGCAAEPALDSHSGTDALSSVAAQSAKPRPGRRVEV